MLVRVAKIACSMILLPAVRPVIVSASRIGTPDETSVPSVRVKRAIAVLRIKSPKIGTRSMNLSMRNLPRSVRYVMITPPIMPMIATMMYQKYAIVAFERLITNCVGVGSAWPKLWKRSAKTGIT